MQSPPAAPSNRFEHIEQANTGWHGGRRARSHVIDRIDFELRGSSYNPLTDASMPLLGLVIRLRHSHSFDDIAQLHGDVKLQITAILQELGQLHYDPTTLSAFSYCLCVFVDEAVLTTPWGQQSVWGSDPMLSCLHNETWGGAKFFALLDRMLLEPSKYADVLLFMYLCLCLGYKGQYAIQADGSNTLQALISRLQHTLRALRGPLPEQLTKPLDNLAPRHYRMNRQWPWWTPWVVLCGVCTAVYGMLSWRLQRSTQEVLQALSDILVR
ncbi:type IVB secretion system protein IcmH/DotU [Pseudomonas urmiensis]|jgi:type VI secretion system protein ImpK|uniref:Type IVB secretion system protein IcmH/DotU n=1 Tax=Pseudomonas urmiensis TaxID=2745493 RepID=A0ABW8P275_9PSED